MSVKPSVVVWVITLALLWSAHPIAQNQQRYKVRLATVPMDGGMRDAVAGTGSASAVLTASTLAVTGTFAGLRSPATTARIHRGATKGVRGPAVGDLIVSKGVSGTISGSLQLTPDQVQSLQKGQLYIQLSSEKAPDGNLWGWILR